MNLLRQITGEVDMYSYQKAGAVVARCVAIYACIPLYAWTSMVLVSYGISTGSALYLVLITALFLPCVHTYIYSTRQPMTTLGKTTTRECIILSETSTNS